MNNKKNLVVIVFVLIVALGAITYWFLQKRGALTPSTPSLPDSGTSIPETPSDAGSAPVYPTFPEPGSTPTPTPTSTPTNP